MLIFAAYLVDRSIRPSKKYLDRRCDLSQTVEVARKINSQEPSSDSASPAQANLHRVKDAIKNYRLDYRRRRPRTESGRHDASKRQALELAQPHPLPGRAPGNTSSTVLMNCVRTTPDSLFGGVPDIDSRKAAEIAKDREKWKSLRP